MVLDQQDLFLEHLSTVFDRTGVAAIGRLKKETYEDNRTNLARGRGILLDGS